MYEQSLIDICNKCLGENDMDWSEIVSKYHLPFTSDCIRKASSAKPYGHVFVSEYFKQKSGASGLATIADAQMMYGTESTINKDGTYGSSKLIQISEDGIKDKTVLLKAHGFNPNVWELVSAKNSIWNALSKTNGVKELYSSKITVKPRQFKITLDDINEWFEKLDRRYSLPEIKTNMDYLDGNKLLLIDLADLHLNLQASMFVTGNEYNCDIAEHLFWHVITDVLSRTERYTFNKIVFTIGGDMLNSDNLSGTTTKGTPQDNELHLFEAYERLCALTIKAIELLSRKAPVSVIYIPGNHDNVTSFQVANYINAWYRNDKNVTVDTSPLPRKYIKWGKTLFVFAHDGNLKTLPKTIADEARKYWSDIDTTEVFLQHLHSEQVLSEDNNMRIQRLPTISAKSKWTVDSGFGSKRQAKSFIFDLDDGMTDVLYTPIKV